MRWSLLVAVCGLSITDVASLAQGPPDGRRLSPGHSASQDACFFASTGMARFQMIQGRLCLDCPRHRKGSQKREQGTVCESITVTAQRGIPSLHYIYQSSQQHLTLSVQNAYSIRIESWFPNSGERAILEQPESAALTWIQTRGALTDEYTGANLLHLRHANAQDFDQHFGTLIQRLMLGQSMEELSGATERAMLDAVQSASTVDRNAIQHCVEQLGAERRSTRIKAERQLLAWGTPVVPILSDMIEGDLDTEQVARTRLVLKRLRPLVDDTPSSLARLLINDRSYWNRLAVGLDRNQLRTANLHLKALGLQPIESPNGPIERIATRKD